MCAGFGFAVISINYQSSPAPAGDAIKHSKTTPARAGFGRVSNYNQTKEKMNTSTSFNFQRTLVDEYFIPSDERLKYYTSIDNEAFRYLGNAALTLLKNSKTPITFEYSERIIENMTGKDKRYTLKYTPATVIISFEPEPPKTEIDRLFSAFDVIVTFPIRLLEDFIYQYSGD